MLDTQKTRTKTIKMISRHRAALMCQKKQMYFCIMDTLNRVYGKTCQNSVVIDMFGRDSRPVRVTQTSVFGDFC